MIIGIEFDRTVTESGKKFYRIAPIVISTNKRNQENASLYLASATVIFAFVYFVTIIMKS
jgi:hypothetical protein